MAQSEIESGKRSEGNFNRAWRGARLAAEAAPERALYGVACSLVALSWCEQNGAGAFLLRRMCLVAKLRGLDVAWSTWSDERMCLVAKLWGDFEAVAVKLFCLEWTVACGLVVVSGLCVWIAAWWCLRSDCRVT